MAVVCAATALYFSTFISSVASEPADVIRRAAWSFDRSDIQWYNPAKIEEKKKAGVLNEMSGWAEYDVEIPSGGWYELWEKGGVSGWSRDIFLDGKKLLSLVISENEDLEVKLRQGEQERWYKECNLWLTKGKHALRFRRLSFPGLLPSGFELVPAKGKPECSIFAVKDGFDVLRVGEQYKIKVTGGVAGSKTRFDLFLKNLLSPEEPLQPAGDVEFSSKDDLKTKTVKIDCSKEGVYQVMAKIDGKLLRPSEFRGGRFAVVDVNNATAPLGEKTLVHDVDCVANTDMGKPIDPAKFVEVNGKTRISETKAGKYRESNDCTGPDVEIPTNPIEECVSYSGFSYEMLLPDDHSAYLMELDYPDDAKRSVIVPISLLSDKGELVSSNGNGYNGNTWESGGKFALTGEMLKYRVVFWANSNKVNIGFLSRMLGHRAAAARIRLYLLPGDGELPVAKCANPNGRPFTHLYEEAGTFPCMVNSQDYYKRSEIVGDFVSLKRWVQLARYTGMNSISGIGVGYQTAFYNTNILDTMFPRSFDASRIALLFCEKYGMKFFPYVFPAQGTMNEKSIRSLAANPDELYPMSRIGQKSGTSTQGNDINALHPVVQNFWVGAIGELVDRLTDSPAFGGVSLHQYEWLSSGHFMLPSLNYGYSDWTISQFEKETGIKVDGTGSKDPKRFARRFEFLTSDKVRDRWIQWRCDKIFDYHRRIAKRIGAGRADVKLTIIGDGSCDSIYAMPDDPRERWLGDGVDLARWNKTPELLVESASALAGAHVDGYFEIPKFPYEKLGVQIRKGGGRYFANSVLPGGRANLQYFAANLAERDPLLFRDSARCYPTVDPEIWREWFSEYEALPMAPFTALEGARDPVAVWFRKHDDGFYFYAVNRESYPVSVKLMVEKSGGQLTALGSGEKLKLDNGILNLELAPFGLRAFRCDRGARIVAAETLVPPAEIKYVRYRLSFAEHLAREMTTGLQQGNLADYERSAFLKSLDDAWDAFRTGQYWRARTLLSLPAASLVYERFGKKPDGLSFDKFPNKLTGKMPRYYSFGETLIPAGALMKSVSPESKATIVDSSSYNHEWNGEPVIKCDDSILFDLDVPADGSYSLSVGTVADRVGVATGTINGLNLPVPLVTVLPGVPEYTAFPAMPLKAGKAHVAIKRDGAFGIYGVKFQPAALRPLPSECWATVGPFPSAANARLAANEKEFLPLLRKGFALNFGPELNSSLDAVYKTDDGRELRWSIPSPSARTIELKPDDGHGKTLNKIGIDFMIRTGSPGFDFNFARTCIVSPDDRTIQLFIGCDWWANAWLNDELLLSDMTPAAKEENGCQFMTKNYASSVLKLKKGINVLLLKVKGGSMGGAACVWIGNQKDISIVVDPRKSQGQ